MSILSIDDYKLISEETRELSEIVKRAYALLVDLSSNEGLARNFATQLASSLEDEVAVSFITSYKNYVIPNNFAGIAVVKWITPEKYTEYLAPSDFCVPLFIAKKDMPIFKDAAQALEEVIRLEAEARHYSYEIRENLNL